MSFSSLFSLASLFAHVRDWISCFSSAKLRQIFCLSVLMVWLVDFSRRFAWAFVFIAMIGSFAMLDFVVNNIKINTDIDQLMAEDLDWRVLEKEMSAAFPQNTDRLVVVIDGENADRAEEAAQKLSSALENNLSLFRTVKRPDAIPFFRQNGLVLLDQDELDSLLDNLIKAQPLLGSLARDMSLRGLFSTLSLSLEGIKYGQATYESLEPSLNLLAQTIEINNAGTYRAMPWRSLMSNTPPTLRDTRKFIVTQPVLDFSALSPGGKASDFIRKTAQTLHLTPEQGVTVRLTGSVALNDQEFASVAQGTETATILSLILVVALLFLALRSLRLILPILITLLVGLLATTFFALKIVGSLNLISVAFAVMFVGIAVDFGIQFGVRFRQEHFTQPNTTQALKNAARTIAGPLTFAAACTTLGFAAFLPTSYRGVSELGLIAGTGMVIAYVLNLTLLPALISLFKPSAEPEPVGYAWMAPIDAFLEKKARPLLWLFFALFIIGAALGSQIHFDYDPLNLKDPRTESVSTLFDIMKDPQATPYTAEVLVPNNAAADIMKQKLEALPEVSHVLTLSSFVPKDQQEKRESLQDAYFILGPTLNPATTFPVPSLQDEVTAIDSFAAKLKELGADKKTALRLTEALNNIHTEEQLVRVHHALIDGLKAYIVQLREVLKVKDIKIETITNDLSKDWLTKDGQVRIEIYPKGDGHDHKILSTFIAAVQKVAPRATGPAVSIQESGRTVSRAFVQAGLLAVLAIAFLSLIVLRNVWHVCLLLSPLFLAGILTLATLVAIRLPLNFANIIALPLLLSLGVSYAIYFVSYWKDGQKNPLQSSMARAVLFSAATTLVAFGSLSNSSHPGTSGMGELLTIALLYSLLSTFFVLPILLNRTTSTKHKR